MQKVIFQTSDNVSIVGNYQATVSPVRWALLLHMMPATKESWKPFQEKLAENGIASLAIDLRGHGESTMQGTKSLNYENFVDSDHQDSINDIWAAIEHLKKKGAETQYIIPVGASIGANLTLQSLAQNRALKRGILMSAGVNYHGIETDPLARALSPEQKLFLVAAGDDPNDCIAAHQAIKKVCLAKETVKEYPTGGHGTNLFQSYPELMSEMVIWMLGA